MEPLLYLGELSRSSLRLRQPPVLSPSSRCGEKLWDACSLRFMLMCLPGDTFTGGPDQDCTIQVFDRNFTSKAGASFLCRTFASFLFQLFIFAKCHRRTQAGDRTRHHAFYVWMGPQTCTDQSQVAWQTWRRWSLAVSRVCHLRMEWLVDPGSSSSVCLWWNYSQWILPADKVSTMLSGGWY